MLLLPVVGLALFLVLPLREALPLYITSAGFAVYARVAIARTVRFPPQTGLESMAGREAVATTALRPAGYVRYRGEVWHAVADRPVEPGARVQIVRVERQPEGFTAVVAPLIPACDVPTGKVAAPCPCRRQKF